MKEIPQGKIKPILVNILQVIDRFCREHKLKYSLAYGTLLGAVRHKGFIPWDDDIDIMMPREDYEFLRKNFEHPIIKLISEQDSKDYAYPFVKIYDDRTLVKERSDLSTPFGLYIDIFPIDGMPSNKTIRRMYTSYFHFLKELISIKNMSSLKSRKWYKKILVKLLKCLFSSIPVNAIAKWMNKSALLYSYLKSDVLGNLVWESYRIKGFDKDIFEIYTDLEFENLQVKAIAEYDNWLKTIYGDYMKLPPEEKRLSRHTFTAFIKDEVEK